MKTHTKGLTLVELMVTLAVAIILVAVGMPLFSGMVENNRATAQANALLSAMKLARSEAVKRGDDVTLCPVDPDDDLACGTADDWQGGWLVHVDIDRDGNIDVDDGELLRRWDGVTADLTLTSNGAAEVVYGPTGTIAAAVSFEIVQDARARRCLSVGVAGGVTMVREQPPLPNDAWSCP